MKKSKNEVSVCWENKSEGFLNLKVWKGTGNGKNAA